MVLSSLTMYFMFHLNKRSSTVFPNIDIPKFFLHCTWTHVQMHKQLF